MSKPAVICSQGKFKIYGITQYMGEKISTILDEFSISSKMVQNILEIDMQEDMCSGMNLNGEPHVWLGFGRESLQTITIPLSELSAESEEYDECNQDNDTYNESVSNKELLKDIAILFDTTSHNVGLVEKIDRDVYLYTVDNSCTQYASRIDNRIAYLVKLDDSFENTDVKLLDYQNIIEYKDSTSYSCEDVSLAEALESEQYKDYDMSEYKYLVIKEAKYYEHEGGCAFYTVEKLQ